MSVESFKWDNGIAEWAMITNRYGKLLSYNLPRYNRSYATCKYQGYITEMLESELYSIFVDVGAFIGLFSQIASHYCDKVIAYEAHPFYFGILLLNMRYFTNVSCRYKYISSEEIIPTIDDDIKGLITIDSEKPYCVECVSLDDEYGFGIPIPERCLIKLDVEGNELNVLKGSKKTLQRSYVHWIIDVHTNRGITTEEVLKYFPNRKITMISHKVIKVEGKEDYEEANKHMHERLMRGDF